MGLISGLVTLPLAPVRGVIWLAEQIEGEAERQWRDPVAVHDQLEQVEQAYAEGQLTEAERDERSDALVARLLGGAASGHGGGRG